MGPHFVGGGGQPGRIGRRERFGGGGQPGLLGDGRRDLGGQGGREEGPRHALRDRAAEQPGRGRHDEQRRDRARPGRLAEHGHQVRVAAERGDVLPDPVQRRHLVEQRPVGRDAGQVGVALHADPVVEGHHHHVLPGQRRAVVAEQAGRAEPVGAAVDPDHDREPGRAQVGREHVDGEPVIGVGVGRGRRHRREQEPGLRRGRPEGGRLPHASPRAGPGAGRRTAGRRREAGRTECRGRRPRRLPPVRGPARRPCGPRARLRPCAPLRRPGAGNIRMRTLMAARKEVTLRDRAARRESAGARRSSRTRRSPGRFPSACSR